MSRKIHWQILQCSESETFLHPFDQLVSHHGAIFVKRQSFSSVFLDVRAFFFFMKHSWPASKLSPTCLALFLFFFYLWRRQFIHGALKKREATAHYYYNFSSCIAMNSSASEFSSSKLLHEILRNKFRFCCLRSRKLQESRETVRCKEVSTAIG